MSAYVRPGGLAATYRQGTWDVGTLRASSVTIGGVQVVGSRAAAIAAPSGGSTVDSEARSALGAMLAALRLHGLIES